MTLQEFRDSITRDEPPRQLTIALAAVWWDAKGNWKQAHEVAAQEEGPAAAWVHAYLHRKEGDIPNARYWYKRADKLPATGSLEQESLFIIESLLAETEPAI
jgi:hypothetical protein